MQEQADRHRAVEAELNIRITGLQVCIDDLTSNTTPMSRIKRTLLPIQSGCRLTSPQIAIEDTTETEELAALQRELQGCRVRERSLMQELQVRFSV